VSILAAAPIGMLLVLMVGLRWSAARAGAVALATTAAVAVLAFGLGQVSATEVGVGLGAEAGFTALTILWIIGPALGIHHAQTLSGATATLRAAMAKVAPEPRLLALLVAWFFALFLEGAAGFGASVALAAPFLVSAGFSPVTAVVAALVGHAVGVSFGAVGTPILPQIAATGMSGLELSRATGIYHSLLGWILLIAMMVIVARATPDSIVRGRRIVIWTAVAGAAFFVPFTLLSQFVGPELPTLAGGMIGAGVFVGLVAWARHAAGWRPARRADAIDDDVSTRAVAKAAAPYLALVVLVLATRLIEPIRAASMQWQWSWQLEGGYSGTIAPLHHPGSMLLAAFCAGVVVQRIPFGRLAGVVHTATTALVPVTLALLAMLGVARIMVHAGMVDVIAVDAAHLAGSWWPLLAPAVGALGTFVTGSATTSNILFTDLQVATARQAGLPIGPVVGAQGMGAAVGNVICPHNIVAASATVGLTGTEGAVLRQTAGIAVIYLAAGGLLAVGLT